MGHPTRWECFGHPLNIWNHNDEVTYISGDNCTWAFEHVVVVPDADNVICLCESEGSCWYLRWCNASGIEWTFVEKVTLSNFDGYNGHIQLNYDINEGELYSFTLVDDTYDLLCKLANHYDGFSNYGDFYPFTLRRGDEWGICVRISYNDLWVWMADNFEYAYLKWDDILFDLVSSNCNNLIMQSGVEISDNIKEYNKDRFHKDKRNTNKLSKKYQQVHNIIKNKNFGSKKTKVVKNFASKLYTNHIDVSNIKHQSGMDAITKIFSDPKEILEGLQTIAAMLILKHRQDVIGIAISSSLIMFKGIVSEHVITFLTQHFKGKDFKNVKFEEFITWAKSIITDIDSFKKNKYAQSFITFCAKIYSVFLCPTLTSFITPIMENKMCKILLSCFEGNDVFSGILQTITYITNAVQIFVTTGSIEGFINTDTFTEEIVEELREVRNNYTLYSTGDLEFITGNKQYEFLHSVSVLKSRLHKLFKIKKGPELKQVQDWMRELDKMETESRKIESHTSARMQPYIMLLVSGSGISKSYLTQMLVKMVCKHNNFPSSREYVYYVNQANKYASGWQNYKTAWIVDDSAAMLSTQPGLNMADWLLRASNNVPHELLGAGVDEKGTLFNRAAVGAFASNSVTQDLPSYARNVSAIERRKHINIVGRVRPQYTKTNSDSDGISTQIDYSKIPETEKAKLLPDAWEFDVYTVETKDKPLEIKDAFGKVIRETDCEWRWVLLCKSISVDELVKFVVADSKKHFANQVEVLKTGEEMYNDKNYCEHGFPIGFSCETCHPCVTRLIDEEFLPDIPEVDEEPLPRRQVLSVTPTMREGVIERRPFFPGRNTNIPVPIAEYVSQQSGRSATVKHFAGLTRMAEELTVGNVMKRVAITKTGIDTYKQFVLDVVSMCSGWFDVLVCDVIALILEKFCDGMRRALRDPVSLMPLCLKETPLGHYIHAKDPNFQWELKLDYALYVCKKMLTCFGPIAPTFPNVERKKRELEEKRRKRELGWATVVSPGEFGMMFGREQCKLVNRDYDPVRDAMLPAAVLGLTIWKFIPSLVARFNYVETYLDFQMGVDVPVEEIDQLDETQTHDWYKHRQEIMMPKPAVSLLQNVSESVDNVSKNLMYVVNLHSRKFVNALSPCNKYIILPKHFVLENLDSPLECVKGKIDGNFCANRKFVFTITKHNYVNLVGDTCLVFTNKYSSHLSTRDIRYLFPSEAPVNCISGFAMWKDKTGNIIKIPCAGIVKSSYCNNENTAEVLNAKNPFEGYYYKCENFDGMCGAPVLSDTLKFGCIYGVHVGGNVNTKVGTCVFITKECIDAKILELTPLGIIKQGGLDVSSYGINLFSPIVHKRSVLLDSFDRCDYIECLGSISKRNTPKVAVVQTKIAADVRKAFKVDYEWGPPPIAFKKDTKYPFRRMLKAFATKPICFEPNIIVTAASDYQSRIQKVIDTQPQYWKSELRILNDFEVVNGVPNKRFLGSLNMASSCHKYLGGKKKDYAEQSDDGTYEMSDLIMNEYHKKLNMIRKHELIICPVIGSIKNEPTTTAKILKGKTRIFFAAPIELQMLLRKFLLTTCRFFCLNGSSTECTVGINPHSVEWDAMFKDLNKHKNWIALDFVNFDVSVPFEIIEKAIDILFMPIITSGNLTDEDMLACDVLKSILLHVVVDLNGDLVTMFGIIASGTNVTSILGCIINSLYFRVAYYTIIPNGNFTTDVILRTFGDDSVATTCNTNFTMKQILQVLTKYGIAGTDFSKKEISTVKYCVKTEVEFLKRKFHYSKDFQAVVAPLEKQSMFKCLSCHLPPRTMSLDAVTGQCIDNFLFEARFHGKDFYESSRAKLIKIAMQHDLTKYTTLLDQPFRQMVTEWVTHNKVDLITHPDESSTNRLVRLFNFAQVLQNWSEWTHTTNMIKMYDKEPCVDNRVDVLDGARYVEQQSGEENIVVKFEQIDQVDSDSRPYVHRNTVDNDDTSIENFLARPVAINNTRWSAAALTTLYDPWNLFLINKRVANRVTNYNGLKANLNLRFVINGNGFYFGRLMIVYWPFIDNDDTTSAIVPVNPIDDWVAYSNMPHVFLDPAISNTAEMVLPFMWNSEYIDLTASVGGGGRALGSIKFIDVATLKNASNDITVTSQFLNVVTYAWMTNVELLAPTATDMSGITAQSGEEKQDVSKPISQACTLTAAYAGKLRSIPFIAPYATALEMAAKLGGAIASVLGYSKPCDVVEPSRMQRKLTCNLAVTNTTDTADKLTTDVKQITSIDTRLMGASGEDEMSISSICRRWSFLAKFTLPTSAVKDDLLFSCKVNPRLSRTSLDITPNVYRIYPTAMAGTAMLFKYWTGSIEFKFVICASAFHKGRLLFSYDPNTQGTREDNTNNVAIVDLATTREFCTTIGNRQGNLWLENSDTWFTVGGFSTTSNRSVSTGDNGILNVYCNNELTTSGPTDIDVNVEILVFVRGGEDLKFAVPNDLIRGASLAPQSGTGISEAPETCLFWNIPSIYKSTDQEVYMGEEISSLRTLLKRYQGYMRIIPSVDTYSRWTVNHAMYPEFKNTIGGIPYIGANAIPTTNMAFIIKGFSALRGAVRWKVVVSDTEGLLTATRTRDAEAAAGLVNTTVAYTTATAENLDFGENDESALGTILAYGPNMPILEFELPFYSNKKFIRGKPEVLSANGDVSLGFKISSHRRANTTAGKSAMTFYVAAGEDFNVFCFTGWPRVTLPNP